MDWLQFKRKELESYIFLAEKTQLCSLQEFLPCWAGELRSEAGDRRSLQNLESLRVIKTVAGIFPRTEEFQMYLGGAFQNC